MLLILEAASVFGVAAPEAEAAFGINRMINYQGKLMASDGNAVADGTYSIKFSFYNQASGGSTIWSASTTNGLPTGTPSAVAVDVEDGLFTILLGDTDQVPLDIDWDDDSLYLGITIEADSEMSPRKRLTAVPYAFSADRLQGQQASSSITNTGGDLFALHQGSTDAAAATRTALYVETKGTSNQYDFLMRLSDGTSDVFTINHQGNVTTTGSISIADALSIGGIRLDAIGVSPTSSGASLVGTFDEFIYSTSTNVQDVLDDFDLAIDTVSETALGMTLHDVALNGNTTTLPLEFAGGTSTGDIMPGAHLAYDLGRDGMRWDELFVRKVRLGTSSWTLSQESLGQFNLLDDDFGQQLSFSSSTGLDLDFVTGTMTLLHDTSNAYFSWSQGELYFKETTLPNSTTDVIIEGNGSGDGRLSIKDGQYSQARSMFRQDNDSFMLTFYSRVADYIINLASSAGTYVSGTDMIVSAVNDSSALVVKGDTGNVGIGTSTPGYKLDVQGDTNISGTLLFGGGTSTGDVMPGSNLAYRLGTDAYKWLGLTAAFVSSTNLDATGYVSTSKLYVNGLEIQGSNKFQANQAAVVTITSTQNDIWRNMTFNASIKETNYNFTDGQATTTIMATGTYRISGHVTFDLTVDSGNERSTTKGRLLKNGTVVIGDEFYAYNRNLASGEDTISIGPMLVNFDAGDEVVMQVQKVTGAATVESINSGILIELVTGSELSGNLAPTFQQVTDSGRATTNNIQFAGGTSTGDFLPGTDLVYDLGLITYRWDNGWFGTAHVGTSTIWDLGQAANGAYTIGLNGGSELFRIDTSGYIGIGTSTPSEILTVAGNGSISGGLIFGGATSTGDILPNTTELYSLGSLSNEWLHLFAKYVSSTSIDALGYVSTTELYVKGQKLDVAPNIFQGTQAASLAETVIDNWGSVLLNNSRIDSYYSHTDGTSQVTINATGTYRISGHISFARDGVDNGRSIAKARIAKNGTTAITDEIFTYNRVLTSDEGTSTIPPTVVTLAAGDYLEIQGALHQGNADLISLSSSLLIEAVTVAGVSTTSYPTWQQVTDVGKTTTNNIQFAGATSTGDIMPGSNLTYDLGSTDYRWDDAWVGVAHIGTSTWDLSQAANGAFTIGENGGSEVMRISTNGNVAIGTTTADYKFAVDGNARFDGGLYFQGGTSTASIVPDADSQFYLGSATQQWLGLNVVAVSTTILSINGAAVTTTVPTWDQVLQMGNMTTSSIQFGGGTSTGSLLPGATDLFSLGSSDYRWSDVFTNKVNIGTSTLWSLSSATNTDFTVSRSGSELMRLTSGGDLFVGITEYTDGLNSLYAPSGDDFLVNGDIGTLGGVYASDSFYAGATSTVYGKDSLYKQDGSDYLFQFANVAVNPSLITSFESAVPPSGWTTGGDANWIQNSSTSTEGSFSAENGDIIDLEISWIEVDYTFSSDGLLEFDWKVSSEATYDFLLFCLDNDVNCTDEGGGDYVRISGETNWATVSVPITAGTHKLRWAYDKDYSESDGSDTGWIDNVRFAPYSGQNWRFFTDATERFTIAYGGNVGIGISAPEAKLDVNGETKARGNVNITSASAKTEVAWTSANAPATGIESVRSLTTFNGYLYAGQGDSGGDGDVLICSADGGGNSTICDNAADWTVSFDGTTFSQVLSLTPYKGKLYAGLGNGAGLGDVMVCDPATVGDGDVCDSGDWADANFIAGPNRVTKLIEYNGYLYAANDTGVSGSASVAACDPSGGGDTTTCDDAADWSNVAMPDAGYEELNAMAIYQNKLYAFVGNSNDDVDWYICYPGNGGNANLCDNSADWVRPYNNTTGSYNSTYSAAVYNNYLYIGYGSGNGDGDLLRCDSRAAGDDLLCDNATDMSVVIDNPGGTNSITAMLTHDGSMYIGHEGTTGNGDIIEYTGANYKTSEDGTGFEATYSFAVLNGVIYAGRGNSTGNGQVYYYQKASESSYALKMEAGSSTGSMWFSSETLNYQGAGTGYDAQSGAFKFSHGLITEAGAYDLAEMYPTMDETISAGDVVVLDTEKQGYISKSAGSYNSKMLGVVSSKPGFLLSGPKNNDGAFRAVALVGRVPVKVSLENGDIDVGDPLTSASAPGYAMKATKPGMIIGHAMESFASSTTSTVSESVVMMVVQTGYYFGGQDTTLGQIAGFLGESTSTQVVQQAFNGDAYAIEQVAGGMVNPQFADGSILNNPEAAQVNLLVVKTAALVAGDLTVGGDSKLLGRVVVSENTAGVVDLPVGDDYVEIQFSTPFETTPVVVVTPESDADEYFSPWMGMFRVAQKSANGFRIEVEEGACLDPQNCGRTMKFNWIAVGVLEAEAASSTDAVIEGQDDEAEETSDIADSTTEDAVVSQDAEEYTDDAVDEQLASDSSNEDSTQEGQVLGDEDIASQDAVSDSALEEAMDSSEDQGEQSVEDEPASQTSVTEEGADQESDSQTNVAEEVGNLEEDL